MSRTRRARSWGRFQLPSPALRGALGYANRKVARSDQEAAPAPPSDPGGSMGRLRAPLQAGDTRPANENVDGHRHHRQVDTTRTREWSGCGDRSRRGRNLAEHGCQEGIQSTRGVELIEIRGAADVPSLDEDLRNGLPAA